MTSNDEAMEVENNFFVGVQVNPLMVSEGAII